MTTMYFKPFLHDDLGCSSYFVALRESRDAVVVDVGRPDFGGDEGASQEFQSVQRLLGLQDYVEVFPAHCEGFCGKGMCGRPGSTIGFERVTNLDGGTNGWIASRRPSAASARV